MKVYLLRMDASVEIGMGHLMRCLALAHTLLAKGVTPIFVCRGYSDYIEKMLQNHNFKREKLPAGCSFEEELALITQIIKDYDAEVTVVDLCYNENLKHIERYVNYLEKLRQSGSKLMIIDDLNILPFNAEVVLNPNYGAEKLPYENKNKVTYLLGIKYFLFRPEFIKVADKQRVIREQVSRVLITLGGSDVLNVTPKVMRALVQLSRTRPMELVIVAGLNEHDKELFSMLNDFSGKYRICAGSDNMAELMLWCDLAITAGGLTKYETALTGTPSIIISQVKHQYDLTELFMHEGTALHLGLGSEVSENRIGEAIKGLLYDYGQRLKMSLNGKRLMDGKGAQRVVEVLTGL